MRHITRGTSAGASLAFHIFVQDSASTAGAGKQSVAYSSFACRYIRNGEVISGAITPEDITTIGTYAAPTANTNIRIKAVDNTNMIGVYEVHIHADWVNTTNTCKSLTIYLTATGCAPVAMQIPLIAVDQQDAVRMGLTALPNAAATAAGGLPVSTAGSLDLDAIKTKTDYLPSATAGAPNGLLIAGTNSSVTFSSITVTNNISVGTTVTFTGAFTATNASNNVNLGTGAITAGVIAADAIGVSEFAAATIAAIADAVWDEATSGHSTAGTTGKALTDASAAGNPWSALTSANTDAGSFGLALGTTIQTTLTTIDDFVDTEVNAIKAKTDLIPAAPAAVGDIPTALQNADALLNRDMSAVSDTNARTPLNALRFLRNKWSISGTTLTVTEEDDTTAAWTSTVTTNASADPVTGNDPA